jgi:nicotinamide-nucleotide amidase
MAEVWRRPLVESAEGLAQIEERFRMRGRTMHASNRRQALIPVGATLVPNLNGTAPGFYVPPNPELALGGLLALPGPPRENRPMFLESGLALIAGQWPAEPIAVASFRTVNIPESVVNDKIRDLFGRDPRVTVALLFSLGFVDVRLTLRGVAGDERTAVLAQWRGWLAERLGGDNIAGEGDAPLAAVVGDLLRRRGQTVAVAESCTGGLIAAALTDVPGSSDYFVEGFVAYANAAKIGRLGVDSALIERHGAVSREVAAAMAAGARNAAGSNWAVATTGVAGPGGGTVEKPVGLVWFGLALPEGKTICWSQNFLGQRDEVRQRAVQAALDALRRGLLGCPVASHWSGGERAVGP